MCPPFAVPGGSRENLQDSTKKLAEMIKIHGFWSRFSLPIHSSMFVKRFFHTFFLQFSTYFPHFSRFFPQFFQMFPTCFPDFYRKFPHFPTCFPHFSRFLSTVFQIFPRFFPRSVYRLSRSSRSQSVHGDALRLMRKHLAEASLQLALRAAAQGWSSPISSWIFIVTGWFHGILNGIF